MIVRITDAYLRHYTDNDSVVAYVEWVDSKGRQGRTEARTPWKYGRYGIGTQWKSHPPSTFMWLGEHMKALFARANREGIPIRGETW